MAYEERKLFLSGITENILSPYEASTKYEEGIVREFENQVESGFWESFMKVVGTDGVLLDLACGDGRHTLRLSQDHKLVVAFDLSPNMLTMAKSKCSQAVNISFIRGSMFFLPFRAGTFDGIWFSQAFEYIPPERRKSLLSNLKFMLRKNGIIYISAETWMLPSLLDSLMELLGDLKLYLYWKFVRGKPLLWGEYLYLLKGEVREGYRSWHYHVHIDRSTLSRVLYTVGLQKLKEAIYGGYIYVLCTW